MFTLEQIQKRHKEVKSGADFPIYIKDLKELGLISYEIYVKDGHGEYFGENNYKIISPAKYENLKISENISKENFINKLKIHQNGGSDYMTFCNDSAENGIERWVLDFKKMTCTYYDKNGNEILVENIPEVK